MKIELLYFEGCPSWQTGLDNLKSALQMDGLDIPVELIQVVNDEDAARMKFLGSPSFRVNGDDLWEEKRDMYSLSCRIYTTPERRVSKLASKGSQSDWQDKQGKVVSRVDVGYSNTPISGWHMSRHRDNVRNIVNAVPDV